MYRRLGCREKRKRAHCAALASHASLLVLLAFLLRASCATFVGLSVRLARLFVVCIVRNACEHGAELYVVARGDIACRLSCLSSLAQCKAFGCPSESTRCS